MVEDNERRMQTSSASKESSEGRILRDRFTSEDIFERIIQVADEEVSKGARELFFSALAAGFAITLTFFLYASMTDATEGHALFSSILYPLGFVYIILGNYQLFTENTLPPVALIIERMASIPTMLTVWGIVLTGNLTGGFFGAMLLGETGIFTEGAASAAAGLAQSALATPWNDLFVRGIMAGFIVAGVVWLDYAAKDTMTRFWLVYLAFFSISVGNLNHSVVSGVEVFYLHFAEGAGLVTGIYTLLLPVLLGNIVGGVILVTIVNYFQTPHYIQEDPSHRLTVRDWLFTWNAGRTAEELEQLRRLQ
jgi:formate/nitrite transporter FocA (FNT family)